MSDLLELAERVEAAGKGSFKLDDAIYEVLFCDGSSAPSFQHYTRSLDAAMALVPEGCGHAMWAVLGKRNSAAIQFPSIEGRTDLTVDGWADWCSGSTAALALTAASLRARAASTPSLNAEIAGMGEGR